MSTQPVTAASTRPWIFDRPRVRTILIAILFVIALLPRTILIYEEVFRPDGVAFVSADAAFHMRTVENLMHHFPHRSGFDPYSAMPTGQAVTTGPLYDQA